MTLQTLAELYAVSESDGGERFHKALDEFQSDNGSVANYFFCTAFRAGCVLIQARSGEDRLYLTYTPVQGFPGWILEALADCDLLQTEIRQVLRPPHSRICMDLLFGLTTQLLRLLQLHLLEGEHERQEVSENGEGRVASGGSGNGRIAATPKLTAADPAIQQLYKNQVARIRDFYEQSAERYAQTQYFFGMMIGAGILSLLAAGMTAIAQTGQNSSPLAQALWPLWGMPTVLISSIFLGGIGAIVSVMQRISAGNLALKYRVGRLTLMLVGSFRPITGAVFAGIAYALIQSKLIPIQIPDPSTAEFFYAAVAFFMGFSERLAQDTLAAGETRIRGAGVPGTDTETPSVTPRRNP